MEVDIGGNCFRAWVLNKKTTQNNDQLTMLQVIGLYPYFFRSQGCCDLAKNERIVIVSVAIASLIKAQS